MINETMAVALCVLAIALVVWGASAFRSGSRVFCRIAPPVTLALFCCFVSLACGVPTGLMHPCMAPAAAVLVGIAACVLVASAFAHIVHSRRVNPMAAATLGVAAALAGVEALSVANVREAASSLAARVLGLLSFIGLWFSFAFVVFIVCSAAYRIAYSPGVSPMPSRSISSWCMGRRSSAQSRLRCWRAGSMPPTTCGGAKTSAVSLWCRAAKAPMKLSPRRMP